MKTPSHLFSIALAALVLRGGAPATLYAAEPAVTAPASAGHGLAAVLADERRQLMQIDPLLDSLFAQLAKATPEVAVLVVTYPDLDKAWKDAMRPIMIDEMRLAIPGYHQELADFFAANLTDNEIRQITAFYGSSTGQALIETMAQSIDYRNVATEIATEIDDTEMDVSATALKKDIGAAASTAARSLTVPQRRTIAEFMVSPVGRKFAKLVPQKQQIDAKWFNREPSPQATARINTDIAAALDAFMAKADQNRGQ